MSSGSYDGKIHPLIGNAVYDCEINRAVGRSEGKGKVEFGINRGVGLGVMEAWGLEVMEEWSLGVIEGCLGVMEG